MSTKLHSSIFNKTLRKWQEPNVEISPINLMLPIFVIENDDVVQNIDSLPGVQRFGINKLKPHLESLIKKGLSSILLFGVVEKSLKDSNGSAADSVFNPVVRALPKLRKWFPDLVIACDVCICSFTDHGHCGILNDQGVDNAASIKRSAEISLAYAKAGAHILAPSDMMDNRVLAIKNILQEHKLDRHAAVLSYSGKFESSLYGPYRDAAQATISFGDRKCYHLPAGSKGLASRAAQRDVEEGADMLMIKPGLPYLDIVQQTKKEHPNLPLFIYQVSGEYAMLYHGAQSGAINLNSTLMEILTSMRRAGADCIVTYYTPLVLDLIGK